MTSSRFISALLLLVLCGLGLWLRLGSIDAFGLSPDDGNYLSSARVMQLDRPNQEGSWFDQDWEWAFGERRLSYRHSYIHQLVIRWVYRSGTTGAFTVRIASVVLGALTALLLYLFYSRNFPKHRGVGWIACALLAGLVIHVWYSRTGWGQIGCTFFWLVYMMLGYSLFVRRPEPSKAQCALIAFGMIGATLLAYGYHEMIVVHVAGMGVFWVLDQFWQRRDIGEILRSRAMWTFAIACIPVTIVAAVLLLGDDFAEKHWTGLVQDKYELNYVQYRLRVLKVMFLRNRLDLQISWPILLLAVPGCVAVFRRDRALFRYLMTLFVTSVAIFFFFFRDPYLIRIYLPTIVLLVVFAAEGINAIAKRADKRFGRLASAACIALPIGFTFIQSWQTIYGDEGAPLAVTSFYQHRKPNRYPLRPIVDHLRENRGRGEILGIAGESSAYFTLKDEGIPARMFNGAKWNRKPSQYPDLLIAPQNFMENQRRTVELGGVYELITTSRLERVGLYAKRP